MIVDALKLAVGTLTTVRVPAPGVIDRRVAGGAMVLAPVAAVPLAAVAAVIVYLGELIGLPSFASAALALGAVALGSRGLHLDGLADTADGLGASYDRARALEVMRRGDSGPTGIATLVLVLLVQAGALSGAIAAGHGIAAAALAVIAGRGVLSLCCARGVPSARPEGLGATVAGSVPVWAAAVVFAVLAGSAALMLSWWPVSWWPLSWWPLSWWRGLVAVGIGYLAASVLLARCVQRLGGVTGDVLGGCVEVSVAAVLLALSF